MNLELNLDTFTEKSTIGKLTIDGAFECYILGDKFRGKEPKVFGKTFIPLGHYKILVTKSDRFSRLAGKDVYLPILLNVPGFEGVRIHPGNKPEDTEGCLLPGTEKNTDDVSNSRTAFLKLNDKINNALKKGEDVWITIKKSGL